MPHGGPIHSRCADPELAPALPLENPGNRNYPDPHVAAVIFPEAINI